MLEFGAALPRIRKWAGPIRRACRATPGRETVPATIVRLLDTTYVRIGNEEYARTNRLFD
jgi:DNA topoisomerase-1